MLDSNPGQKQQLSHWTTTTALYYLIFKYLFQLLSGKQFKFAFIKVFIIRAGTLV